MAKAKFNREDNLIAKSFKELVSGLYQHNDGWYILATSEVPDVLWIFDCNGNLLNYVYGNPTFRFMVEGNLANSFCESDFQNEQEHGWTPGWSMYSTIMRYMSPFNLEEYYKEDPKDHWECSPDRLKFVKSEFKRLLKEAKAA